MDRELSIKTISLVASQRNATILEKHIFEKSDSNDDKYKWIVYQVIGMLLQNKKIKEVNNEVKDGRVGWKHYIYDGIESKLQEHDDYLTKPFEVVDGVVTCPKCQGMKTWSVQKQTRSSDEPMTTFSRCALCNHQWSYSG